MASPTIPAGDWTYERYLTLDDEQRYEIIDGELLVTPAPLIPHQRVLSELSFRIHQFVRERGLGEFFVAPTDVVLDQRNVVQPDILFIARDHTEIIDERAVHGPPDLAVEILSYYPIRRDRHAKTSLYQRAGVREYWIVDPANRAVEIFSLGEAGYELASFAAETGEVESGVLEGLHLSVAEVFGV